jgi:hypothetical protein
MDLGITTSIRLPRSPASLDLPSSHVSSLFFEFSLVGFSLFEFALPTPGNG